VRAVLVGSRPAGDRRHLTLEARELAEAARPGQFVMVAVPGALLRRPFWISGAERTTIDLFVEVAGPGTAWLTGQPVGSELDVLGPLGRPFPPPDGPAALVGDTGTGPLRFLAAQGAPVVPLGEASVAYAVGTPPPGIRSWVAVTAPMACGTGLCWTCAVPVVDGPPARACLEGPVFDAARVDWTAVSAERIGR
jgi:dihydroorotate dehydrogenase electron transfer subunit